MLAKIKTFVCWALRRDVYPPFRIIGKMNYMLGMYLYTAQSHVAFGWYTKVPYTMAEDVETCKESLCEQFHLRTMEYPDPVVIPVDLNTLCQSKKE